jgi:hypothetical protein
MDGGSLRRTSPKRASAGWFAVSIRRTAAGASAASKAINVFSLAGKSSTSL